MRVSRVHKLWNYFNNTPLILIFFLSVFLNLTFFCNLFISFQRLDDSSVRISKRKFVDSMRKVVVTLKKRKKSCNPCEKKETKSNSPSEKVEIKHWPWSENNMYIQALIKAGGRETVNEKHFFCKLYFLITYFKLISSTFSWVVGTREKNPKPLSFRIWAKTPLRVYDWDP